MPSRSLLLHAPRRLEWIEEELPQPGSGEVLVRTLAGAVSVGTELPFYRGAHRGSGPVNYPRMTGYESVAEVVRRGAGVRGVEVGDRVVSFYGHRTHAVVPESRLVPVPKGVPDPLALLVILAADTAAGVSKADPRPDDRVLVTGAGTIGLLTLFNLRVRGVRRVDVAEPLPARLELARRLGARDAGPPEKNPMPEPGYAVGFECSGRNAAFGLLQKQLMPGGRLCVLSDGNVEPLGLLPEFHEKELRVFGSSDAPDYQRYATWFCNQPGIQELESLFEMEVTPNGLPQLFDSIAHGDVSPIKALVRYAGVT